MNEVGSYSFPAYFLEYIEGFGIENIDGNYYYKGDKLEVEMTSEKLLFRKSNCDWDSVVVEISKKDTLYLDGDAIVSVEYQDNGICLSMNGWCIFDFEVSRDILTNISLTLSSDDTEFVNIPIAVGENHLTPQEYINLVKSRINSNNRVIDQKYLEFINLANKENIVLFMKLVDILLDDPYMLRLLTKAMDKMEPDLTTALANKLNSIISYYNNELDEATARINEERKGAIDDTLKYYARYVNTVFEETSKANKR